MSLKIIIATMVKNEDDIIDDWILYHGNIFGYHNLFIIDNYSTDNTYKKCLKYINKGINLCQKKNYIFKGDYMTNIMKNNNCDIFIPLDIDEFIVYYDNNEVKTDNIINYLNNIIKLNPNNLVFKCNYISPILTNNNNNDLDRFKYGDLLDYGNLAKSFINKHNITNNFLFDHGNHMMVKNYIVTKLCLIHYHQRTHKQCIKKIYNNVLGLGHNPNNLQELEKLKNVAGIHRIKQQIQFLKNPNHNFGPKINKNINGKISLKNFYTLLLEIKKIL